jgi:HAD superfamily hydrolase (TIGR01509 family)
MRVQKHADIDLVIFDADGVLVDSETIAIEVLTDFARRAGADLAEHEALPLFRGRKIADCVMEIERRARRPVSEGFIEDVRAATALAFETRLRPVPGVRSALAALRLPMCVASNGPQAKLTQTLRLTRLHRRFGPHVYSAYEVGSWKPDPGLFLHAAKAFGADPGRCVVVEDSTPGVVAGRAAGMRVLGYAAGDAASASELAHAGAEVFDDMRALPGLVA